jgi:hypothetical protein
LSRKPRFVVRAQASASRIPICSAMGD